MNTGPQALFSAADFVFRLTSLPASRYSNEAEKFLEDLRQRFSKFALQLHPEKTRLIEFGRFAAENRRNRGEGKPETFNFLGFTQHLR
jgi:hypothetical protein